MKRYEKESLFKNFLIFFSIQAILLAIIVIQNFNDEKKSLNKRILNEMRICSYNLKCDKFDIDFVSKKENREVSKLYFDGGIISYYSLPTIDKFLLKISLRQDKYLKYVNQIREKEIRLFIIYLIVTAILSFIFSLYALYPLKKALKLNEEFMKDILHDINTPLSSMLVNFSLLKRKFGESRKIERIESNVNTIISLQNNLKTFLNESNLQIETFFLDKVLLPRVEHFKMQYSNLSFNVDIPNVELKTNKEAFIRIVDNILSNACKYNKESGLVSIYFKDTLLVIEDTGIGIKNPSKVFDRYYKENERGLGIGMHIVKKLCNLLGIKITIRSKVNEGSGIFLNLKKILAK